MNAYDARPHVFFSLNAEYHVAPEATARALLDDVSCLLGSATELVNSMAFEIGCEGSQTQANLGSASSILFGVVHMLQMAKGAVDAANFRTERPDL